MLHHRLTLRAGTLSFALAAASLAGLPGVVHAQATTSTTNSASLGDTSTTDAASDSSGTSSTTWALGGGIGVVRKPYRNDDTQTKALPLLMYDSARVHFFGTTVDLKLGSYQQVSFTLRAQYANDGYSGSDAPILNGMADRRYALWLGGTANWHAPWANLSLDWLQDSSGHSGGQTLKLNADRGFRLGRFSLTPHLGVAWYDKSYVDYYYGVNPDEANSSRSAYTGRATVNTSVGLRTGYRLTTSQNLFLDATATHLGSGITDSPLVDRATVPSIRLGYLYQF